MEFFKGENILIQRSGSTTLLDCSKQHRTEFIQVMRDFDGNINEYCNRANLTKIHYRMPEIINELKEKYIVEDQEIDELKDILSDLIEEKLSEEETTLNIDIKISLYQKIINLREKFLNELEEEIDDRMDLCQEFESLVHQMVEQKRLLIEIDPITNIIKIIDTRDLK